MDVDVGREAVIRESKHKKPKTCTSDAHSMRLPMPILLLSRRAKIKATDTHTLSHRGCGRSGNSREGKAKIENCMCVTDVRKQ